MYFAAGPYYPAHDQYCIVTQCLESASATETEDIPAGPRTADIMSYYKGLCPGPYTIVAPVLPFIGRVEALTPEQIERVRMVRETSFVRLELDDVCGDDSGGDSDFDGWCDDEDPCPMRAHHNPVFDGDSDGVIDGCDLCPDEADPTNSLARIQTRAASSITSRSSMKRVERGSVVRTTRVQFRSTSRSRLSSRRIKRPRKR